MLFATQLLFVLFSATAKCDSSVYDEIPLVRHVVDFSFMFDGRHSIIMIVVI